jgi:hypothetical protein
MKFQAKDECRAIDNWMTQKLHTQHSAACMCTNNEPPLPNRDHIYMQGVKMTHPNKHPIG